MNRAIPASPKRSTPVKGKKTPPCKDVTGEFCQRFLSMMASFYDNPSSTEITTFPPAPKPEPTTPKQQQRKVDFSSPVADLRLKRKLEAQASQIAAAETDFMNELQAARENVENQEVDMTGVFDPETSVRSEIPKYMLLKQLDEEEERNRRTIKSKPLDIMEFERQGTQKLEMAKKRGINRAMKRREKMEASTPTKEYYKSPVGRDKIGTPGEARKKREAEAAMRRTAQKIYSAERQKRLEQK